MGIKSVRETCYRRSARGYSYFKRVFVVFLSLCLEAIILHGVVTWFTASSLFWGSLWPVKKMAIHWILLGLVGGMGVLAVVWFIFFKWYSLLFRYGAYFASWIVSMLRRVWAKWWIKFLALVVAVHGLQWWRYVLVYHNKSFDPINFLKLPYAVKTLVITGVFLVFYEVYKARKLVHISDFKNYTGIKNEQLEIDVNGVGSRILKEMNRVMKLLQTIDEIQPDKPKNKFELLRPKVDTLDYGKDLSGIVGSETDITIGPFFKIPLAPLINFFSRLLHGPTLDGALYRGENKLILDVQLKGGKFKGAWSVNSDEIEGGSGVSENEKIMKMIEVLVFKIFAYLGGSGSPRWQAVKFYTEGLMHYRESTRVNANEQIHLIKAKRAFGLSLRDDGEFFQCYYNLGIVYLRLESYDAAEAAFRKVLELDACNYHGYFQLAYIYYLQNELEHSRWFCEEALTIFPSEASHWNLLANIKYIHWLKKNDENGEYDDYTSKQEVPEEVVADFMIAAMLAWRACCKGLLKGEKITDDKNDALIFIRNLAKIKGERKEWGSGFLFKQALFFEPDHNDLLFEMGCFFYRRGKIKKAYRAFRQVFEDNNEIDDSCLFWAYYLGVNARLYQMRQEAYYQEGAQQSYLHFLECVAKNINNPIDEPMEDVPSFPDTFQRISHLFLEDFQKIAKKGQVEQLQFIPELKTIETCFANVEDSLLEVCKKRAGDNPRPLRQDWSDIVGLLFPMDKQIDWKWRWTLVQIKIFFARKILKETTIETSWELALPLLENAIHVLKKDNPNEIKLLCLNRYLAEGYYKLKRYEEALKYAREAVRLNPYDPLVRLLLGKIYIQLMDYTMGLDELEVGFNFGLQLDMEVMEKMGDAYLAKYELEFEPKHKQEVMVRAHHFFAMVLAIIEDKSFHGSTGNYLYKLKTLHHYLGIFCHKLHEKGQGNLHDHVAQQITTHLKKSP